MRLSGRVHFLSEECVTPKLITDSCSNPLRTSKKHGDRAVLGRWLALLRAGYAFIPAKVGNGIASSR